MTLVAMDTISAKNDVLPKLPKHIISAGTVLIHDIHHCVIHLWKAEGCMWNCDISYITICDTTIMDNITIINKIIQFNCNYSNN